MADVCDGQWTMESFRAHPGLGLQEDITKKGRVLPMENGQWKGGSAGDQLLRPTLLLTTAGLGEWAMENGGRSPPAAPRARDPVGMTNWARPMRLLRQWNGQWLPERWRVSSEGGSGPR